MRINMGDNERKVISDNLYIQGALKVSCLNIQVFGFINKTISYRIENSIYIFPLSSTHL
jgi:hypothetical protein